MIANPFMARWDVVAATQHALRYGGASLRNVAGLLKQVMRETLWQDYVVPTGEVVQFSSFPAFVTSPWGLDTTLAMIERICAEDSDLLDLLGRTIRAHKNQQTDHDAQQVGPQGQHLPHRDINEKDVTMREGGNAATYALRR